MFESGTENGNIITEIHIYLKLKNQFFVAWCFCLIYYTTTGTSLIKLNNLNHKIFYIL